MTAVTLVPLSLGELLDQTFSYFRKHFWLFAGIMLAPEGLMVGFNILVQVLVRAPVSVPGARPPAPAQMAVYGARIVLAYLAVLVPFYITYALALGATAQALSEIHLGRMTTIRDSYRAVRKRLGRLMNVIVAIPLRGFGLVVLSIFVFAMLFGLVGVVPKPLLWVKVVLGLGLFVGLIATGVFLILFLLRYSVAIPAVVL